MEANGKPQQRQANPAEQILHAAFGRIGQGECVLKVPGDPPARAKFVVVAQGWMIFEMPDGRIRIVNATSGVSLEQSALITAANAVAAERLAGNA